MSGLRRAAIEIVFRSGEAFGRRRVAFVSRLISVRLSPQRGGPGERRPRGPLTLFRERGADNEYVRSTRTTVGVAQAPQGTRARPERRPELRPPLPARQGAAPGSHRDRPDAQTGRRDTSHETTHIRKPCDTRWDTPPHHANARPMCVHTTILRAITA